MDATLSITEKLQALPPVQKQIVTLLAKDYRIDEISKEIGLTGDPMFEAMRDLIVHMGYDPAKGWDKAVSEIADIGRENGFMSLEPKPPAPGSGKGETEDERQARIREARAQRMRAAREARGTGRGKSYLNDFPPIEETAKKVAELSEQERKLFIASTKKEWREGGRAEYANSLDIAVSGLATRLRKVMDKLGLQRQRKVKKYAGRVAAYFEAHKEELLKKESPPQTASKLRLMPAAEPEPERPQLPAAAPTTNGAHPPAAATSAPGQAAVLAIPATVEDVDVLSGQFSGTVPAEGLREQIALRKEAGFKPSMLVLTTTNDPRVAQAQMVFFKHEK